MAPRALGALLALVAAIGFVVSVASSSWWSGHPSVDGHTVTAKAVRVGLLGATGCNTGGDGTCESVRVGAGFQTAGLVELGAIGLATILAFMLAVSAWRIGDRRKHLAAVMLFVASLATIGAIGILAIGPALRVAEHVAIPIGWGVYVFGGAIISALASSLIARKLEPEPLRLKSSSYPIGTQPSVRDMLRDQHDGLRPAQLGPEPMLGPSSAGPSSSSSSSGSRMSVPLIGGAPQLRPLYESEGFVPGPVTPHLPVSPPTPVPKSVVDALQGNMTPAPEVVAPRLRAPTGAPVRSASLDSPSLTPRTPNPDAPDAQRAPRPSNARFGGAPQRPSNPSPFDRTLSPSNPPASGPAPGTIPRTPNPSSAPPFGGGAASGPRSGAPSSGPPMGGGAGAPRSGTPSGAPPFGGGAASGPRSGTPSSGPPMGGGAGAPRSGTPSAAPPVRPSVPMPARPSPASSGNAAGAGGSQGQRTSPPSVSPPMRASQSAIEGRATKAHTVPPMPTVENTPLPTTLSVRDAQALRERRAATEADDRLDQAMRQTDHVTAVEIDAIAKAQARADEDNELRTDPSVPSMGSAPSVGDATETNLHILPQAESSMVTPPPQRAGAPRTGDEPSVARPVTLELAAQTVLSDAAAMRISDEMPAQPRTTFEMGAQTTIGASDPLAGDSIPPRGSLSAELAAQQVENEGGDPTDSSQRGDTDVSRRGADVGAARERTPMPTHAARGGHHTPIPTKEPRKGTLSTAPSNLKPPKPTEVATSGPTPACPQCESPMAWVDEHLRFYCKQCRMYF